MSTNNHCSIGKNEEKNEREFEREKVPILRNDHIMALTYVAYRLARLKVMKVRLNLEMSGESKGVTSCCTVYQSHHWFSLVVFMKVVPRPLDYFSRSYHEDVGRDQHGKKDPM